MLGIGLGLGGCTDPDELPRAVGQTLSRGVRKVIVEGLGGGFAPPVPQGAACDPQRYRYVVEPSSAVLDWQRCEVDPARADQIAGYQPKSGSRILDGATLDAVLAALRAIRITGGDGCGADKAGIELTLVSSSDRQTYGDDFYGCFITDKPVVDSQALDGLVGVLRELAE